MKRFSAGRTLGMGLVVTFMGIVAVAAQTTDQRFASKVEGLDGAFVGLSTRADMIAFHKDMGPEADICRHYQGFARKDGPDGWPLPQPLDERVPRIARVATGIAGAYG